MECGKKGDGILRHMKQQRGSGIERRRYCISRSSGVAKHNTNVGIFHAAQEDSDGVENTSTMQNVDTTVSGAQDVGRQEKCKGAVERWAAQLLWGV